MTCDINWLKFHMRQKTEFNVTMSRPGPLGPLGPLGGARLADETDGERIAVEDALVCFNRGDDYQDEVEDGQGGQ